MGVGNFEKKEGVKAKIDKYAEKPEKDSRQQKLREALYEQIKNANDEFTNEDWEEILNYLGSDLLGTFGIKTTTQLKAFILETKKTADTNKFLENLKTLNNLPRKEALLILEWRENFKLKSLFNYIYSNYQENTPNLSREDFFKQIESKSIKEIKEIVKKYRDDEEFFIKHLEPGINKSLKILKSEEFTKTFDFLKTKLGVTDLELPYYKTFLIFRQNNTTKQEYLTAIHSKEFTYFHKMLKTEYGISPNHKLLSTIGHYLDPKSLSRLEEENTKKAFAIFKKYFPNSSANSIEDIFFAINIGDNSNDLKTSLKNGHYESIIVRKARNKKLLKEESENSEDVYLKSQFEKYNITTTIADMQAYLELFELHKKENLEEIRYARLKNIDISSLIKSEDFKSYVEEMLSNYSDENKKAIDNYEVAAITRNFVFHRKKQEDLNKAFSKIGKLTVLDLDLEFVDLKLEILKGLEGMQFLLTKSNSMALGIEWGILSFEKVFTNILKSVKEGKAKRLYDSLNNWNIHKPELGEFIKTLVYDKFIDFFTKEDSAKKCLEIIKKYGLISSYRNGEMNLNDKESYKKIFDNYDFLINKKTYESIKKYFSHKPQTISNLDGILSYKSLKNPKFIEIANILEQEYSISNKRIMNLFGKDDIPSNFLAIIKSEKFKQNIRWISDFYSSKGKLQHYDRPTIKFQNSDFFEFAMLVNNFPKAESVFNQIDYIGIGINHNEFVEYIKTHILSHESAVASLLNEKFPEFYKRITEKFYGGDKNITAVIEITELFSVLEKTPEKIKLLFSDDFQKAHSFIKKEFNITNLHYSTLLPILQISKDFDARKYKDIIEELNEIGEKVTANDLILISEILKDQDFKELLFDRDDLEESLEHTYDSKEYSRLHIDQVVSLQTAAKNSKPESKKKRLILKSKKLKEEYSERPPLVELSNLQLLRLYLFQKSMQDPDFIKEMGRIVSEDIENKSTEYGGTISFENKKIGFNSVKSHSEFNGAYMNRKYRFLINGIATFHLHALEKDNSKFSGPSGWLNANGGDIASADFYDSTDLVITTMGHPKDPSKNEIKDKLIVNIDMYYVDKRRNKKLRIIDMGAHIIPYNK